ncbi:MAG: hypothetical protein AMXMBFR58_36630 [Phycisphaerae bacterium]
MDADQILFFCQPGYLTRPPVVSVAFTVNDAHERVKRKKAAVQNTHEYKALRSNRDWSRRMAAATPVGPGGR